MPYAGILSKLVRYTWSAILGSSKNLTQIRKSELYLSSEEIGLDDGFITFGYVKNSHVGIEQAGCFFIDTFFDAQELFEAVINKKGKVSWNKGTS